MKNFSKIVLAFSGYLWALFSPPLQADTLFERVEVKANEAEVTHDPGMGMMVIPGRQGSTLELNEAFPLEEGCLLGWVRPVNWAGQEQDMVHLVSAKTETAWLSVYKYQEDQNKLGLIFLYGRPSPGGRDAQYTLANTSISGWKKNQWHHFAATWSQNDRQIVLYLDGKEVSSSSIREHQLPDGTITKLRLSAANAKPDGDFFRTAFAGLQLTGTIPTPDEIQAMVSKKQAGAPNLEFVPPSVATIPYLARPPVIDGVLTSGEWDEASVLFGGIQAIIPVVNPDQTFKTYAGYDDEHIYLMMVSRAPGMKLRAEVKENGTKAVFKDDSIEVFFAPDNEPINCYQFIGNSQGFHAYHRSKDAQWKADWEYRNTLYEGYWYAELKIPIRSIFTGKIGPGTRWSANFVRNWRTVEPDSQTAWSFTPRSFYSHMGELIFGAKGEAYRLNIDELPLQEALVKGSFEALAPEKKVEEVTLSLVEGTETVLERKQTPLTAGARANLEEQLPSGQASNLIVEASDKGEKVIFRQSIPMKVRGESAFRVRTDFEAGKLIIEAPSLAAAGAVIRLLDETGKEVRRETVKIEPGKRQWVYAIDARNIPAHRYTFEVQWLSREGGQISVHQVAYNHIGQPEWLDWDPQLTKVPKPWTAISYGKEEVGVWGRRYGLQKAPFPASVVSGGTAVIPEPVTLTIVLDGEPVKWEGSGEWTGKKDWEGIYSLTGRTKTAAVAARTHFEFDGLWYVELDIVPTGAEVEVQEIKVDVPLEKGLARRIYAHNHHRDVIQGAFDPKLLGRYLPHVWIGNHEAGVTWFTESNQYWSHRDAEKAIRFVAKPETDLLQVTAVDKPFKTKTKVHYLFGLQATPIRETASLRRSLRISPDPYDSIGNPWQLDRSIFHDDNQDGLYGALPTFPKSFSALENELKRWREKGVNMAFYVAPDIVSPTTTEWEVFGTRWKNPHGPYQWGCVHSDSARFQTWFFDRMIQHADLRAIYVDCAKAYPCANELHGCGYRDEAGAAHVTTPILSLRKYLRNLYVSLHESRPVGTIPPALVLHMSAGLTSVAHGFSDIVLEGEEINHRMVQTPSYFDLYPPDKWQAIFGHQQGVNVMLLPNYGQVGPKEDQMSEVLNATFLTQALLNDTPIWNVWSNRQYVSRHLELVNPWIRDPETEFLPYWSQKFVSPANGTLAVSLYRNKEGILATIGNFSKEDQRERLDVDWKGLGLDPGKVKMTDLVSRREIAQGSVIAVPRENFLLLKIALE
ncbi:MAG TPA: glycoside hydrolase domain-containing protein [Chthoniobacteraceae bacterium]|nr:glycoside hydrolase domain-containing protein [Chthoniobacteraceae bacterium]